jgi:hypothetical protein
MTLVPAAAKEGSGLALDPGALLEGEAARARRWGVTLSAVSTTYLPAHT